MQQKMSIFKGGNSVCRAQNFQAQFYNCTEREKNLFLSSSPRARCLAGQEAEAADTGPQTSFARSLRAIRFKFARATLPTRADPGEEDASCRQSRRSYVGSNSTISLSHFEGLVLGCIEAKFCR